MIDPLYLGLIFIIGWLFLVIGLDRAGVLERYGFQAWGPALLWKTERGKDLLDRLASYRTFWKVFASIGVPAVLLSMAGMLALVLISLFAIIQQPPEPSQITEPRNVLLIPGVNQFVPLLWGIIGLAVTLVVHEMSHAVLARAEDIEVKSMGLIFFVVPIGGFAEPDEDEMERAAPWSRIRVFSAGMVSNLVVAVIAFAVLMWVIGMTAPVSDGVVIRGVEPGAPADLAGLETGMVITGVNGSTVGNSSAFLAAMNRTAPNQTVTVSTASQVSGGVVRTDRDVTLAERNGKGFLGVMAGQGHLEILRSLPDLARNNLPAFLVIISGFPIVVFQSVPADMAQAYLFDSGFLATYGISIINALIWIAWIDFWVAVFNAMPATILDGGHIFKELLDMGLLRAGVKQETAERMSRSLTHAFGLLLLGLVVLTVVVPRI